MKIRNSIFKISTFLTSILVMFMLIHPNAYSLVQRDATIVEVKGDVQYLSANQTDWKTARKNLLLKKNDSIRTVAGASAVLAVDSVAEGSTIKVGPNTQVKIADLALDENTGVESTLLDLAIGNILIDTNPTQGSQFKVKTPTAIVGARGTSFKVNVNK